MEERISQEKAFEALKVVNAYIRQLNETVITYSGVPANTMLKFFSFGEDNLKFFRQLGIKTVGDLLSYPRKGFKNITHATRSNMREIDRFLDSLGIQEWV